MDLLITTASTSPSTRDLSLLLSDSDDEDGRARYDLDLDGGADNADLDEEDARLLANVMGTVFAHGAS